MISLGGKKISRIQYGSLPVKEVRVGNRLAWSPEASFVAVGQNGRVMYSPDGHTWYSCTAGTAELRSVCYGNGRFVAVGEDGSYATSTDGKTWTVGSTGSHVWNRVCYGNGWFVSAGCTAPIGEDGGMGVFMYSSDGVSWTIYRTEVGGTRREWLDVNYCNGTFVAVGYRETITTSTEKTEAWTAYSENPSKWTGVQVTSKGMDKLLCITNDGIRYIALGILYSDVDFRVVLSSTDGSTWTKLGVSEVSDVESRVCFGSISSGVYAGVYGFNKYSLSDDAVAWNLNGIAGLPSGKFPYLNGICFGDGRLVAVGNVIAVSESGRADLSYLGEVDQSVLNDVCHKGV